MFQEPAETILTQTDTPDTALHTVPRKMKLFYSKREDARFFGHLELVNIINRALRRAGVDLVYSNGFHPMPKISFADPLPMGMEGFEEVLFISVKNDISCDELVRKANRELPEGVCVKRCEVITSKQQIQGSKVDHYTVTLKEGVFDPQRLDWFSETEQIEYTFTNKKGVPGSINLKTSILSIDLILPNSIQLIIENHGGKRIRPAMVLEKVFALPMDDIKQASILKGGIHV